MSSAILAMMSYARSGVSTKRIGRLSSAFTHFALLGDKQGAMQTIDVSMYDRNIQADERDNMLRFMNESYDRMQLWMDGYFPSWLYGNKTNVMAWVECKGINHASESQLVELKLRCPHVFSSASKWFAITWSSF